MSPEHSKLQQAVSESVNIPKGQYSKRGTVGSLFVMATSSSGTVYVGVVDDDESHCRSLARLLRAAGMQPVTYSSAEAFRADTKRPQFDCLVLDIQLPGVSGLDLQKILTAEGVATPVLFITAYDDPSVRAEAIADGCAGFFLKTDSGTELLDAISAIASGRAVG